MDDLIAFLNARLDEDEAAAQAVTFRSRFIAIGNSVQSPGGAGHPPMPIADVIDPETAAHIARHDPARVLRDVAADRKLIAAYEDTTAFSDPWIGLSLAVRIRAGRFSDHPDYRQEWKP